MILIEFEMYVKFVQLIMEYVTTVSYSLLLNGGLTAKFQGKKRLRQGDPISPYLFVLVMEYLNMALKNLKVNPNFNYHPRWARNNITHICFADDLILCCRADKVSINLVLDRFNHFSEGQALRLIWRRVLYTLLVLQGNSKK